MKNVTVSVPDEVYQAARVHAASHGTSVSAVVAEFLGTLGHDDEEFQRLLARQEELYARVTHFDGADRLTRDELHDRAVR